MQEQEEEEEEIERERGRKGAFFKGILNSLNALVLLAHPIDVVHRGSKKKKI